MKHPFFKSSLKILAFPLMSAMSFSANAVEPVEDGRQVLTDSQRKSQAEREIGRLWRKAMPHLTSDEKNSVVHYLQLGIQRDFDYQQSLKPELERGVDFLLGSLREKDFEKGLKILEDLGRGGDGRAYTVLGKYFLNGENLQEGGLWFGAGFRDCVDKVDFERAHTFFKKAAILGDAEGKAFADKHPEVLLSKANQGDSLSQVLLGTGFLFGAAGFERNIREAVKWFEKASGELSSCGALGKIYRGVFDGFEGVDHKKAVEWFHKAEKMGSGEACFYLSLHYANGDGVSQDREKASYYADCARKYWIGGAPEILNALANTPSDQRIENPRKDAVMVWRKPVAALGKGDRF